MPDQLDFFSEPAPTSSAPDASRLPDGFQYRPDLITPDAEHALLTHIRALPFRDFEFHGHVGKRRTVSFGAHYDFSSESLRLAEPIPPFLFELRATAAAFAELSPTDLQHVLVTEYGEHAGIGWHRDKSVFGDIVGISLLSACKFRLRRKVGLGWQRVTVDAAPRSAYLLRGASRTEWEHSIPEVETPRYSITFRTLAT